MFRNACGRITSRIDCQYVIPSACPAITCPLDTLWIPARMISL